jgi:hypothetical protein
MELNPTERQLLHAIEHADHVRGTMSPTNVADWNRYVDALRGVSIASWGAMTDVNMRFAVLRAVLNEVR